MGSSVLASPERRRAYVRGRPRTPPLPDPFPSDPSSPRRNPACSSLPLDLAIRQLLVLDPSSLDVLEDLPLSSVLRAEDRWTTARTTIGGIETHVAGIDRVQSTILERVARRDGFSRKHLHPTRFSKRSFTRALRAAGFDSVDVHVAPTRLALMGWARAPR